METKQLLIEMVLNNDKLKAGLQEASTITTKSTGIMSKTLGQIKVGWLAVYGAIKTVIGALKNSVTAYMNQEKADRRLAASLLSIGDASTTTRKRLISFASELQKTTGLEDDAIENLISFGLQMGISTDKIEDATKGAIGLSKAFGMDLEAAMKAVAMANKGQFTQLARYIPELRVANTEAEKASGANSQPLKRRNLIISKYPPLAA